MIYHAKIICGYRPSMESNLHPIFVTKYNILIFSLHLF